MVRNAGMLMLLLPTQLDLLCYTSGLKGRSNQVGARLQLQRCRICKPGDTAMHYALSYMWKYATLLIHIVMPKQGVMPKQRKTACDSLTHACKASVQRLSGFALAC